MNVLLVAGMTLVVLLVAVAVGRARRTRDGLCLAGALGAFHARIPAHDAGAAPPGCPGTSNRQLATAQMRVREPLDARELRRMQIAFTK